MLFGAKKKKLEDIEKKLDMTLAAVLEIQMLIGDKQQMLKERRDGLTNYFKTMRENFAAKGFDTTMFDQLEPIIGKKP